MEKKGSSIAEILPTHTAALFQAAVERATVLLRAGEVVALPTETVYGLAANAFDARAVEKIFTIKGRPAHNPIIVHVADLEMVRRCVLMWPDIADKLAKSFWPGPLTMVLSKSEKIPENISAGGKTVGIRWPSHPFIQAVIRECGFPLAAPSANPSNQISPTNAVHVAKSLGDKIRLIVDGGQSQVGIESTVLDLTVKPPRLLRPGMISVESLMAAAGNIEHRTSNIEHRILRSPGQLKKHYSPKAKLIIRSWKDERDLRSQLSTFHSQLPTTHVIAHTNIPLSNEFGRVSVIPHDAEAFARAIYAELHHCDEEGAKLIVVEELPKTEAWHAIADRLNRAAT